MNILKIRKESFALHTPFGISRSRVSAVEVVAVGIKDKSGLKGWGECRPYGRYNESAASVMEQIKGISSHIEKGVSRVELLNLLPAGAARFAVDSALWDLEAKQKDSSVWDQVSDGQKLASLPTMQTISLDSAENMAAEALKIPKGQMIKIKLGGEGADISRIEAIHNARPEANLVVDANEGFDVVTFQEFLNAIPVGSVHMIEQPLPADKDEALQSVDKKGVLLCGDESIHTASDIAEKQDIYDVMNIKLDKSGGLTHALEMLETIDQLNETREVPLKSMVGCMVSSSLSIQPAFMLAQFADYVDLDGPWWLSKDRDSGVAFDNGYVLTGKLWGEKE